MSRLRRPGTGGPAGRTAGCLERPSVAAAVLASVVLLVTLGPDPVPVAGARLLALAALVAAAGVTVARVRAVDLGAAAVAGVGALTGAVLPAVAGWPALLGLPLGVVSGAVLGTLHGAVIGRTGRQLGALATLAIGVAVVQVLGTLDVIGGVGGFHAVGLATRGGDRSDALAVGIVALVVIVAAGAAARRPRAAAAAVATADPALAASLGRSPVVDVAVVGGIGGGLLGAGGALLAVVDGSVVPGAYGLQLVAALVVGASVGGAGWLGPLVGAALVWGPTTLFPLAPLVGSAPVLLTAGPLGLGLLAWRRGRSLLPPAPAASLTPGNDARRRRGVDDGTAMEASSGTSPPVLRLRGTPTPSGPVDLTVARGEIVAVTGPNGSGKSTLLARIGGQLPDDGTVDLDGRAAPRGARRRARAGVARSWQRPPEVAVADIRVTARLGGGDLDAEAAAADLLGPTVTTTPAGAQLIRVVGSRPLVALLDEPTDLPPDLVGRLVRLLAAGGAAVVLVDHRPEVAAYADHVERLGGDEEVGG
ncbi:MAG: ATP-binding cassette domain-containing protein [Nitriliruptor sp.]|uniref:ATP-binding cassette domain-containing protein n=1 Tax=Nitriliruptor sp. TaxID=2448056 RepID=UPI0034A08EB1